MWYACINLAFVTRVACNAGRCFECIVRKSGLVRLLGMKYCDALKYWCFRNPARVTALQHERFALDGAAKHQYSAASGAFWHCEHASVD